MGTGHQRHAGLLRQRPRACSKSPYSAALNPR
jgi:hypothetical protein